MRLLLTGPTGFVGTALLTALTRANHQILALTHRKPLPPPFHNHPQVFPLSVPLHDTAALSAAIKDCDGAIHLVGIITEHPRHNITFRRLHVEATRHIVAALTAAGVSRYVHMSAAGARPNAVSAYHQTKYEAEQLVRASSLHWTIFQPSLIHGPASPFIQSAAGWAKGTAFPYFFLPYFRKGLMGLAPPTLLQPIHVDHLAEAFVQALGNPQSQHQTYPLGGSTPLTWSTLLTTIAQHVAPKPKPTFPLPAWYAKLLTHIAPASLLPFNLSQVQMATEDNTVDLSLFHQHFGYLPPNFETTFPPYAKQLL